MTREEEVSALLSDAIGAYAGEQIDTLCSLGCQGISLREAGFVLCLTSGEEFLVTVMQVRDVPSREGAR